MYFIFIKKNTLLIPEGYCFELLQPLSVQKVKNNHNQKKINNSTTNKYSIKKSTIHRIQNTQYKELDL